MEQTNLNYSKPSQAYDKRFTLSAAVILVITGFAKVASAFGSAKLLEVPAPVVGITFRDLIVATGLLELVVAFFCLRPGKTILATMLVAWLATNFFIYRVFLWATHYRRPCHCLGNLTDALHLSPQLADNVMKGLLAYLLIGSYALLIVHLRQRGRASNEVSNVLAPL